MFGDRPIFSTIFFTLKALLVLGVWSHTLEASSCQTPLYGREGGTIVLSPGPINEKLYKAQWKYKGVKIADSKVDITGHQFSGRVTLDKTNYSLTVKELKTTDSGDFTFISQGTSLEQRPTHCIRLVVQEVLTPTVTVINITHTSHGSCVILTECSSKFHKDVSYKWTVNNRNYNGTTLEYSLTPQEGAITVTCTVSNMVSEVSERKSIYCPSSTYNNKANFFAGLVSAAILLILPLIAMCWYKKTRERSQNRDAENGPEDSPADNQQQLYSSLLHSDVNVYESIRGSDSQDCDESSLYTTVCYSTATISQTKDPVARAEERDTMTQEPTQRSESGLSKPGPLIRTKP